MDHDLLILSNGGLADNLQITHCLTQVKNIALQKRVEGIPFYQGIS